MKKTLLSILAFISLQQLHAQTLTSATHNPVSGDIYSVMLYDSTTALPLTTGTNQTWDFSGNKLKSKNSSVIQFYTPTTQQGAPAGANLAEDHLGKTTYYKTSNNLIEVIGYNDNTSTFTLASDSVLLYRSWPLSFGNRNYEKHNGTYTTTIQNFPSPGVIKPDFSYNACGKGTVISPDGKTFQNILLVIDTFSYEVKKEDANFITGSGQSIISYKFYSADYKFPIMNVSQSTSTIYVYNKIGQNMSYWEQTPGYSVEYYNPSNPTNSLSELNEEQINIYPNPAKETIQVDLAQLSTISIIDLQGKVVLNQGQENQVQVANLQPGIYSIIATDKNGQQFRSKFIKE